MKKYEFNFIIKQKSIKVNSKIVSILYSMYWIGFINQG